ncbi:MAG: bifunctional phosphoribosyl-AMP cyclohydrolase/phosphoribosyl-ATP diphosphatase HisIE [Christensenellales bacterium]
MVKIEDIKFDSNGLVLAVVQDYYTKQVLMCAYMNKESLEKTLETKSTWFYSRSKNELWNKGATSGNTQEVVSIVADCDKDALLVEVIKKGPACHLGTESCFENTLFQSEKNKAFSYKQLYEMLQQRKNEMPEGSYTTYLFEKGLDKILKKVGEESTEVIVGAKNNSKEETTYEIADLVYHVMVLMVEMGIEPKDIFKELASRHVIDKKVKQETSKV